MLCSDESAAAGDTGDTTPGAEDTTLTGAGDTTDWLPEGYAPEAEGDAPDGEEYAPEAEGDAPDVEEYAPVAEDIFYYIEEKYF